MYMLLTLALVCTAAASSGYGTSNDGPSQSAPAYGGGYGGGNGGYGGVPIYEDDSYGSDSSSSEERPKKCKKPKKLSIAADSGYTSTAVRYSFLERKGKTYIKLSCPDDGKNYALVGDADFTETGLQATIPNVVFLAEGLNIDLVARCKGKKMSVESINKGNVKVKEVACVWLGGENYTDL